MNWGAPIERQLKRDQFPDFELPLLMGESEHPIHIDVDGNHEVDAAYILAAGCTVSELTVLVIRVRPTLPVPDLDLAVRPFARADEHMNVSATAAVEKNRF